MFFTIGLLYVVFRSKPVQTWLTQEITTYLSKELGTKVRIGAVDIDFFKTAVLENIYMEDQKGDTMFYFRKLKIDYHTYDKEKRIIKLNYLGLEGGKILFGEHKGETVGNYEFLIDYFDGGPRDPNKPKIIWTVYSASVSLENMRFDYFSRNDEKPDFMDFDYNEMSWKNINGSISDFYLIDDSLHFQTQHLDAVEKCGFVLTHLSADTKIHAKGIEFTEMVLQTPYSNLKDKFIMQTRNWKDYNDFNDNVVMKARLLDSDVDTRDLAYFSNNLKEWETLIHISGSGEGPLSHMRGKDTKLKLYGSTEYEGDWSMTGLPDFENTILDFDVRKFVSNYEDLDEISLNNIPENFKSLGTISYKGMFSGFFNDFITFGEIKTDIGDFQSDINIKYKDGLEKAIYSGTLKTDFFRIKAFIPEAQIDEIAFDANIKGTGLSRDSYHILLDGAIPSLVFQNHTFTNIVAKGEISRAYFTGNATIRDEDLDMDFDGEFRSDIKIPEAHFKATVNHANLASFGLDSIPQFVKGVFVLDFTGYSLDDAEGSITGEDVFIERNGVKVSIPYINLSAYEYDQIKELRLRSDLIDASIKGQFRLELLDVSILHMLHQLIPAYFSMPQMQLPNEDFVFDFDLKKPYDLTSLYMPRLRIEPCKGKGNYRSSDQVLDFNFNNNLIAYDDYELRSLRLNASKRKGKNLNMQVDIAHFTDQDFIKVNNILIKSNVFDNVIDFTVAGIDTGYKIGLNSIGRILFKEDSIYLQMSDMQLAVADMIWKLDTNAVGTLTDGKFLMDNFAFRSKDQLISVVGELGESTNNRIDFQVGAFALSTINYFTKSSSLPQLNGVSNGKVVYTKIDGQNRFQSDLDIINFGINKDTIGDLSVFTSNKPNSSIQHLRVYVDKGLLDSMRIEGDIDYKSKNQNLKLYAHIPPTELRVFEPYLEGVMSNMKGQFYTKDSLSISGSFSDPVVEGEVLVKNAEVLIDFLKVPIRFSAKVVSAKDRISVSPFTILDDKRNVGKAKAFVFHKSFSDFSLNLNLYELNKFHVLNTGPADNDLFYGQAYANGNATLIGPFENLDIRVNAKTTAGTKFYLPISEGDASGLPSYIHFKTAKKKVKSSDEEMPIHSLAMDIEATNDADVEIIFDEILGDKITGSGHGNLKMEMNKSGDFYMFGNYTVDRGRYLFTAFDLYNKPFNIRPGGTITWYGDPLDAKLNLVAYNSEITDPSPLLSAVSLNANLSGSNATVQAITAESELYLKGNLFSPEISFGLNFPKLQTEAGNFTSALSPVISRIKSDKEEVSRQVFSLLLMKKFLPPTFAQADQGLSNAGSTALSSAGTDLLSSQLSNWLNKIDPNWKVNVIYKNGSITLPPEYGLKLSSRFLNDKLMVDGSFSNYSTIPNINLEYKVTKKGNIKIKAYTRSSFNQVNTTSLSTPITTNGLGIVYTKEFNVIRWFKWLKRKKKKNKSTPAN